MTKLLFTLLTVVFAQQVFAEEYQVASFSCNNFIVDENHSDIIFGMNETQTLEKGKILSVDKTIVGQIGAEEASTSVSYWPRFYFADRGDNLSMEVPKLVKMVHRGSTYELSIGLDMVPDSPGSLGTHNQGSYVKKDAKGNITEQGELICGLNN